MRLAVVNNQVPFVRGGAELLVDGLTDALIEHGHEVQPVRLPFAWDPPERILDHVLSARLTHLQGVDRVIALKFPAYFVPHDDKVLWLLHQFRQAYDLWGTPNGPPETAAWRGVRDAIVAADDAWLPDATRTYTISTVIGERLRRFNNIDSEVLLHPLPSGADGFRSGDYGDYVFCPGRISGGKRQHLLLEALAATTSDVRLVVAGPPDAAEDAERLRTLAAQRDLGGRLELVPRFISEAEKRDWLADALAVAYAPIDEDSYGYVTLEAYEARRPVITCSDSGGILELVRDAETGLVAAPTPEPLAAAMDTLMADRARARALGEAGHELVGTLDISWDRVVETLTR